MRIKHIIPKDDRYNHAPHIMCPCEAYIGKDDKGVTIIRHRPMDYTWDMLVLIDKTGVVQGEPDKWFNIDILNHVS